MERNPDEGGYRSKTAHEVAAEEIAAKKLAITSLMLANFRLKLGLFIASMILIAINIAPHLHRPSSPHTPWHDAATPRPAAPSESFNADAPCGRGGAGIQYVDRVPRQELADPGIQHNWREFRCVEYQHSMGFRGGYTCDAVCWNRSLATMPHTEPLDASKNDNSHTDADGFYYIID